MNSTPNWLVLAQSHFPAFQALMDDLAGTVGHGLLLSGLANDEAARNLTVKRMPAYDLNPASSLENRAS